MTYPAWFDIHRDEVIRRSPAAFALYAEIVAQPGSFVNPIDIKAWAYATRTNMDRMTVSRMLELLISRGYLDEHTREKSKAPRRVTVALKRRIVSDIAVA